MPAALDTASPLSYELDVMTIVNNEGDGFDIKEIFQECNIYESIHRNFLLGEVVISDQVGFLENAKLFGQESIRIRFRQPVGLTGDDIDEDDVIDKVFRIYKVDSVMRIKNSAQVFKINFCSPEMLKSKRTRISQAFRGSFTDIAAVVAEDYLGIINEDTTDKFQPHFEVREKSQGDNYHVVVPNWTVGYTDRKSTRLNSSHGYISYAVFCLKKKKQQKQQKHKNKKTQTQQKYSIVYYALAH